MNREAWDKARAERACVAAEAVGMVQGLLIYGQIPELHRASAEAIVAKWDAETEKMREAEK